MKVSPPVKFPGSALGVGIVHLSSGVCDVGHSALASLKWQRPRSSGLLILASPTVCEASKHFLINARLSIWRIRGRQEMAGIS
jgi:hypothetical protein